MSGVDSTEPPHSFEDSFERLKAAHVSLQEDYVRLQKDLKNTLQSLQDVRSNHVNILQKADRIISEKDATIKQLRVKLSSVCEDDLRKKIEEELRDNFADYTKQLQINHEKCKVSLHEANVQLTDMKSMLQSAEKSHQRAVQELNLKHRAEVNRLQVEVQSLKAEKTADGGEDVLMQLLDVQKENADLRGRLKSVSLELKELTNEKHDLALEKQAALQKHTEELALAEESNRIIETKLKGALSQREALEETLARYRQEINQLSQQLVSSEEEKLSLRNKISLAEHKHKAEILQLRTDAIHQRAELEAKYEKALLELASAKADAEVAIKGTTDQKQLLVEKEKELEKKHHATRAKDWDRARRLESEKILLEAKLKEITTAKAAAAERLAESEKQIKRLKQAQDSQRQEFEEEVLTLKAKLKAVSSAREDTNKVAADNQVLQRRLALAEEELGKSHAALKDMQEQKEVLSRKIEALQLELQAAQVNTIKLSEQSDRTGMQMKLAWEQEKYDFVKRIEELEAELRQAHKEFNWKLRALKQRNREYRNAVHSYRSKIKSLKSANQEMHAEAGPVKQSVHPDIHKEFQDELKKLRRQQLEFRSLLELPPALPGNAGSLCRPNDRSWWSISELKEKLDRLDMQQCQQMDQMITLVKKLSTVTHQSPPSSIDISSLSRRSCSSKSSSASKEHHHSSKNEMSAHLK
ncbi:LOW QUALITY PROTEIN: leucine-rich repeat-containing protein 45-like [Rhipicephalus sanguineus]|uniref:LOW QUALITY PROTEIN: leucine-rich repeat-containing protein 45-like n=1 Tax=Rhipicephalus sanguineus TaxID=34632 RepID=UPI001894CBCE|nr:LOW QUALITY PROTEIN: leucine-rich repeat-containing protein 45-like [Rhipicephalus sanguineus]